MDSRETINERQCSYFYGVGGQYVSKSAID